MSETMRERIARAIAISDGIEPESAEWHSHEEHYDANADAALSVLEQPDEAMIDAMKITWATAYADGHEQDNFNAHTAVLLCFQAAIAAARKGQ